MKTGEVALHTTYNTRTTKVKLLCFMLNEAFLSNGDSETTGNIIVITYLLMI